jgi:TetR/AcrR family transcriptional repressor of nem operon
MRYDKEHKAETRRRIIETAGRRLKRDGVDGSGVATLMADAGLTNGAFYAHFASKQELVATAVSHQLDEQAAGIRERDPSPDALERFVHEYLSTWHRDNRDQGCPSAALLDEMGRCDEATRRAYTASLLELVDDIAAVAGVDAKAERTKLLGVYALLVGTLQLSRALTDPDLADALLEQGIQNAMLILAAP